ncbi:response regulator receiver domain [Ancylomarina sp. DW003]|nr:response regulator receiver domain [Ancylomarina sp. DW003]MDE5422913.1 response regulator receiver domain [Ancylomarina sp. DW003]
MSFDIIAKEVIVDSIRSAICIDDSYASAYSDDKNLNHTEPKDLYESFRNIGKCDLDIYQFKNLEESWNKEYMLSNKDLMILDWELSKIEPKYSDTLAILSDVIKSNKIPFVVIYTSTPELGNISRVLFEDFNFITKDFDRDSIITSLNTAFGKVPKDGDDIDFDNYLDSDTLKGFFFDYLNQIEDKGDRKDDILSFLRDQMKLKINNEAIYGVLKRVLLKELPTTDDLLKDLSIMALNADDNKTKSYNIKRINAQPLTLKIDGTTILIYHKKERGGVNPEELFEVFSQAIIANPNNYLSLLSLELKDQLREEFSKIGTRFSEINETAFFYHMQNFRNKENKEFNKRNIYDFVIKSWLQDLNTHRLDGKSKVVGLVDTAFDRVKSPIPLEIDKSIEDPLIKYSALISTSIMKREDQMLRFGDIFKKKETDEFYVCITPHCDCVNPSEKINNNFYFIKGSVANKGKAISEAEKKFYSFLEFSGEGLCIKWSCKPFTAYIVENNVENLSFTYKGEDASFEYITTLKENFAQRLSNESFGYGYRVGIDLPHAVSPN